jgi:DNA/RNA endonuclease YhcR with UshA esterase domain
MIEASIGQATLLSAGCKSVVDDGSGPAVVWMPNALYSQLVDPEGWNVGGVARVTGRVSDYKGEIEIVPQHVRDVVIVARAPPLGGADAQTGSLSSADVGRRVTVEGTVVAMNPFSAGAKCILDDGSGPVVLLLWQNILDALPNREMLVSGIRVRVRGWVDKYRGELEIVPGLAYDVVFVDAVAP